MTHRSTWKRRERDAARLFGAERQPLSGSSGRPDRTRSDSTHGRLYVETKLRAASSVRTLWERVRDAAGKERKTPVLILYAKGKPGGLIVVHQDDLATVAAELAAGSPPERLQLLLTRRGRRDGETSTRPPVTPAGHQGDDNGTLARDGYRRRKPTRRGHAMSTTKPKALLYRETLATVEQRIVDALPDIIDELITRAREGDTKAAVYLCDRILGRVAGSALPPADDRRAPYTEDAFRLDQQEREENDSMRRLLAGFGASNGA